METVIVELKKVIDQLRTDAAKKDALVEKLINEISMLRAQIEKQNKPHSPEPEADADNTIMDDIVLGFDGDESSSSGTPARTSTPFPKDEESCDSDFEQPSTRRYRRRKRSGKSSDDDLVSQSKRANNKATTQDNASNLSPTIASTTVIATTTAPATAPATAPVTASPPPQPSITSGQESRTRGDATVAAAGKLPANTVTPPSFSSTKVPPIVLRDKTRYNHLISIFNSKKFRFTRAVTLPEGVRIHPETPQDFRNITRFLEENRESYHTFQFQEDKLNHVVLRGVVETLTTDEIACDLREKGHNPHKVIRWHYKSGDPMPMVLVLIPKSDKAIFALTEVRRNKIRAEPQHSKSKNTQCYNCQLFGHSSHLCRAPPKCVKCGQGHLTSSCQKLKEAPAKCANCEGEHTASYRGCPKHPSQRPQTDQANTQAPFSWANRRHTAATPAAPTPNMTEALTSINSMNSAMQTFFKNIQNFQKLSATFMPLLNSNAQV